MTSQYGTIAVRNVRLFDGSQLVPGSTVVISNGVIEHLAIKNGAIGADLSGAQVIDGAGGVLLPGLIDAHVHLDGPGRLETLVAQGVTTALDMASVPEETSALRGTVGSADFRSAGLPAIAPGSLHSHFPGIGQRGLIAGPDEAPQFVADRMAEGSDYIRRLSTRWWLRPTSRAGWSSPTRRRLRRCARHSSPAPTS